MSLRSMTPTANLVRAGPGSQEKLGPTSLINRAGGMMKEFARSQRCVTRFGKAHLQCFDLRVVGEVIRCFVTSRRRGVLSGKDRRPTRSTEDSRGMRVGKADAARREPIDVWRQCVRSRVEASNPVVHVVDRKQQNVGLGFVRIQAADIQANDIKRGSHGQEHGDGHQFFVHGWFRCSNAHATGEIQVTSR